MQPVASRWRALGSKHYRAGDKTGGTGNFINENMLAYITMVLSITGVLPPTNDSDVRIRDFVNRCVGPSVATLWKTAEAFAQKIREHVHSTDYELLFAPAEAAFKTNFMRAQGLPAPSGGKNKKGAVEEKDWTVVCMTDLGLGRITNRSKPGESVRLERKVMSKAVVLFEHEVEGM